MKALFFSPDCEGTVDKLCIIGLSIGNTVIGIIVDTDW